MVDSQREQLIGTASAILKAYNEMGCRVLNVGSHDLAAGKAFVLELEKQAKFPFISANILDAESKQTLFGPSLIIETPGRTLGFVGVSSGDQKLKEFEFSDPVEAANKAIAKIKDKVDLVFLLANVDDKTQKLLTQEVKDVDFLIRSNSGSVQRNPKEENGVVVISIGKQGKYVGVLTVTNVDKFSSLKNVSPQYTRINFSDNRLLAMSKGLEEGKTLEEHYADDEKRLQLISRLRDERQTNVDLIKSLKNTYYLEAIALNEKVEDAPEVASIVADYMPKENESKAIHK